MALAGEIVALVKTGAAVFTVSVAGAEVTPLPEARISVIAGVKPVANPF